MALYDSTDCYFSWDGDYAIDDTGDLADTSDNLLASVVQEIQTIVKSEVGDWLADPSVGATLSDFVGSPNTQDTANKLYTRLIIKLTENGIVSREDLNIQIVPVGIYQVMIMISVSVAATANNKLVVGQVVNVNIIYDTSENGILVVPPTMS
jgi:hypothetical protein